MASQLPKGVTIRVATRADFDGISRVFFDAFQGTVNRYHLCPDRLTLPEEHRTKVHAAAQNSRTESYLKKQEDGNADVYVLEVTRPDGEKVIESASVWLKPRDASTAADETMPTPEEIYAKIGSMPCNPPFVIACRQLVYVYQNKYFNNVYGVDGQYQLDLIATHRSAQKHGYGRLLLDDGIERARNMNGVKAVTLNSTPEGYKLYADAGFKTVAEAPVEYQERKLERGPYILRFAAYEL